MTAIGVVVAQIVAWVFPIPDYERHNETGVSINHMKELIISKITKGLIIKVKIMLQNLLYRFCASLILNSTTMERQYKILQS